MASNNTLDPMSNLMSDYFTILDNLTIKYDIKAKVDETYDYMISADKYMSVYEEKDNFFSYSDYTVEELNEAGIYDPGIIKQVGMGNISAVPEYDEDGSYLPYRDILLTNRRISILASYEEQNDYYRVLNGYPPKNKTVYFYIPENIQKIYNLPPEILRVVDEDGTILSRGIPIHKIQDYYNKVYDAKVDFKYSTGLGDYYISLIEGNGYIDELIKANPDETYLKYLGSNRVHVIDARHCKNFDILLLKKGTIKQNLYDKFIEVYTQCRRYFTTCLFNPSFRQFFEYYDNFISMSIFIMTIQQITMRQLDNVTKRIFFDTTSLKLFYETFDIPYNLYLDEETQNSIAQNVNLLLQNKATNKVIYDIANILGFSNIHLYKYYLTKNHKYNTWGVPKFQKADRFNKDSGVVENVYDLENMFDVYFQRADLLETDIDIVYKHKINKVQYQSLTESDPFWVEDENLFNMIWQSEYNFVESKYLSLGVMYSMTDLIFDNVVLLKFLLSQKDALGSGDSGSGITLMLPRILKNTPVHLFDTIVLLLALTARSHNVYGEIIWEPTKIIAVKDYMQEVDGFEPIDTFGFNMKIFDPNACGDIYRETTKKRGPYLVVDDDYLIEHGMEFDNVHMKYISVVINDLPSVAVGDYVLLTNKFEYATEGSTGPFLIVDTEYLEERGLVFDETVMVYKETVYEVNNISDDTLTNLTVGKYVLLENKFSVMLDELYHVLTPTEYGDVLKCINTFNLSKDTDNNIKLRKLNEIFSNVKVFYKLLLSAMDNCRDIDDYMVLNNILESAFYSKTMKEIFSITGEQSGTKRVAWSFFEYLYYLNPALYNVIFTVDRESQYREFKENGGYYVEISEGREINMGQPVDINDFVLRADLTTLRNADGTMYKIDYSKMLYEDDDTTNQKNELVYFYVSHICSRLSLLINVKSFSMLGNNQSAVEDMLLKLVRFFKSFTVDLISLNAIYVIDLKHSNLLKLIDSIPYMHKLSVPVDEIFLRYADVVSRITAKLKDKDELMWYDKVAIYGLHVIKDYIRPLYKQFEDYINDAGLVETENEVLNDWKLHNLMFIKGTETTLHFIDFLRKADVTNRKNPIRVHEFRNNYTEAYDYEGNLIEPEGRKLYVYDNKFPYIWNSKNYEFGLLDSKGEIVTLDEYLVDNNSVRLYDAMIGAYSRIVLNEDKTHLFDLVKRIKATEYANDECKFKDTIIKITDK